MWSGQLLKPLLALTLLVSSTTATTSNHAQLQAQSRQQPIQVYLHPSPSALSSQSTVPTLNAKQAQAVLGYHLSSSHPVGSDESASRSEKSRVIIIQGSIDAQDIIPSSFGSSPSHPQSPSFYLPSSKSTFTFLSPYVHRAGHVLDSLISSLGSGIAHVESDLGMSVGTIGDAWFKATDKASKKLHEQLQALNLFVEDNVVQNEGGENKWESILITGLGNAGKGESESDRLGCEAIKASLDAMTSDPSSPPLALIILSGRSQSGKPLSSRQLLTSLSSNQTPETTPSNSTRPPKLENASCYASNRTCVYSSNACGGHGECTFVGNVSKSVTKTGECWACACVRGYDGPTCAKKDYVFQVALLVLTPLLLILIAIGSISLLSNVGNEALPSSLSLSIGGGRK